MTVNSRRSTTVLHTQRDEEVAKLLQSFGGYLHLAQFDSARQAVDSLFQIAPDRAVHVLQVMVLKKAPSSWLFTEAYPSPVDLARFAFEEHNRLLRLNTPSRSVPNQFGFVTHNVLSIQLLSLRNLIIEEVERVSIQVHLGDYEFESSLVSTKALHCLGHIRVPVLLASATLKIRLYGAMRDNKTYLGECHYDMLSMRHALRFEEWTSLHVPSSEVGNLTKTRAKDTTPFSNSVQYGKVHAAFHWHQTDAAENGFPRYTEERLDMDKVLADVIRDDDACESLLGRGQEYRHVVEVMRELMRQSMMHDVNVDEHHLENMFAALGRLLVKNAPVALDLIRLLISPMSPHDCIFMRFGVVYLKAIHICLSANRHTAASKIIAAFMTQLGTRHFPNYDEVVDRLLEILFLYSYNHSKWKQLSTQLVRMVTSTQGIILDVSDSALFTDANVGIDETMHVKRSLYEALLDCSSPLLRHEIALVQSKEEDVFFAVQMDGLPIPACFAHFYDGIQQLQATKEDAKLNEEVRLTIQTDLAQETDPDRIHQLEKKLMDNEMQYEQLYSNVSTQGLEGEARSMLNAFWSEYLVYCKISGDLLFEFPLRLARSFIRKQDWKRADIVLCPFPILRSLVLLLEYQSPLFNSDYALRRKLFMELWSERPRLVPSHAQDKRLDAHCHRIEAALRLIESLCFIDGEETKMRLLVQMETEPLYQPIRGPLCNASPRNAVKQELDPKDHFGIFLHSTVLEHMEYLATEATQSSHTRCQLDVMCLFLSLRCLANHVRAPDETEFDSVWDDIARYIACISDPILHTTAFHYCIDLLFLRTSESMASAPDVSVLPHDALPGMGLPFFLSIDQCMAHLHAIQAAARSWIEQCDENEPDRLRLLKQGLDVRLLDLVDRGMKLVNNFEKGMSRSAMLVWMLLPIQHVPYRLTSLGTDATAADNDTVNDGTHLWDKAYMLASANTETSLAHLFALLAREESTFPLCLDLVFSLSSKLSFSCRKLVAQEAEREIDETSKTHVSKHAAVYSYYLDQLCDPGPSSRSVLELWSSTSTVALERQQPCTPVAAYLAFDGKSRPHTYTSMLHSMQAANPSGLQGVLELAQAKLSPDLDPQHCTLPAYAAVAYLLKQSRSTRELAVRLGYAIQLVDAIPESFRYSPFALWLGYRLEKYEIVLELLNSDMIAFKPAYLELLSRGIMENDHVVIVSIAEEVLQNTQHIKENELVVPRLRFLLGFVDRFIPSHVSTSRAMMNTIAAALLERETDRDRIIEAIFRLKKPFYIIKYTLQHLALWRDSVAQTKQLLLHAIQYSSSKDMPTTTLRSKLEYYIACLKVYEHLQLQAAQTGSWGNAFQQENERASSLLLVHTEAFTDIGSEEFNLDWLSFAHVLGSKPCSLLHDLVHARVLGVADMVLDVIRQYHMETITAEESKRMQELELLLESVKLAKYLSPNARMRDRVFALGELDKVPIDLLESVAAQLLPCISDASCKKLVSQSIATRFKRNGIAVPQRVLDSLVSTDLVESMSKNLGDDTIMHTALSNPAQVVQAMLESENYDELRRLRVNGAFQSIDIDAALLQAATHFAGGEQHQLAKFKSQSVLECYRMCRDKNTAVRHCLELCDHLSKLVFSGAPRFSIRLLVQMIADFIQWCVSEDTIDAALKSQAHAYYALVFDSEKHGDLLFRLQGVDCSLHDLYFNTGDLVQELVIQDCYSQAHDVWHLDLRHSDAHWEVDRIPTLIQQVRDVCADRGRPYGITL